MGTKGVVAAFVATGYPPVDWCNELKAMQADGTLLRFLAVVTEDADAKDRVESFVMITDTRILVFPDVNLEPEEYTETLVKDVRRLIMLDDALELHISSTSTMVSAPDLKADVKTLRIALPHGEAQEAGKELLEVLVSNAR